MSDSLPFIPNDPPPPMPLGESGSDNSNHSPVSPASQDISLPRTTSTMPVTANMANEMAPTQSVSDQVGIDSNNPLGKSSSFSAVVETPDVPQTSVVVEEQEAHVQTPPAIVPEEAHALDSVPMERPSPIEEKPSPETVDSTEKVMTTGTANEKRDNFIIIISVLIALVVLIWTWVAYLFVTNKQISEQIPKNAYVPPELDVSVATPTPTVAIPEIEYSINNGHVVSIGGSGETTTIINKNDFPETGDLGFAAVSLSPDKTMLCAYSFEESLSQSVYVSSIDGTDVVIVGTPRKECVWSPTGDEIAYLASGTGNEQADVFIYNIESSEETNLTIGKTVDGFFRIYTDPVWSTDGETITISYTEYDAIAGLEPTAGLSEIDIATGEITDKI